MDEETRRHYEALTKELNGLYPNDARTSEQIGFVAVNYWRIEREVLEQRLDGAKDYASTTISEQGAQVQAIANIEKHYARQIRDLEHHFGIAVEEIHRENGIPFKENGSIHHSDDQQSLRVKIYDLEGKEARKQTDDYINRDAGQRATFVGAVTNLSPDRLLTRSAIAKAKQNTPELQIKPPSLGEDQQSRTQQTTDRKAERSLDGPTRKLQPGEQHRIPGRYAREHDPDGYSR